MNHPNPNTTYPFQTDADSHVTFVYAHPDDELMNSSALMSLTRQHVRVSTVFATAGEATTKGERAFVGDGGRKAEAYAAMELLGVSERNILFLGLPDGLLSHERYANRLAMSLAEVALRLGTTHFITTGKHGYGHPDHSKIHVASVAAGTVITRLTGKVVPVWGLSERPGGENFSVDPVRKLAALSLHASQFTLQSDHIPAPQRDWIHVHGHTVHPDTWLALKPYRQLFEWESYVKELPVLARTTIYDILGSRKQHETL